MNVLHPSLAIAGGIAIAIPIIIHFLMRRRRTPAPWGAMRFLLEAYRKQKRRLRIEQLILLACRCLIVALAAAAIARPILNAVGLADTAPRSVVLVIDNSLAAGVATADGAAALESHKAAALATLSTLAAERGDRAGLITLGGPADARVLPPSSDLAAVRALVNAVALTDSRADLPGALEQARAALAAADAIPNAPGARPDAHIAVFSGLSAGSADPAQPLPVIEGSGVRLSSTAPAASGPDNVAITGVRPVRRVLVGGGDGAGDAVRVDLARSGPGANTAGVTRVRVAAAVLSRPPGGPEPASALVRWTPGQRTQTVSIPAAMPRASAGEPVVIEASIDRDALEADNTRRVVVQSRERLRVAVLAPRPLSARAAVSSLRPADWAALALDPDAMNPGAISGDTASGGPGDIRVSYEPAVTGERALAGFDAVIVPDPRELTDPGWAALRAVADAGGVVFVIPPPDDAPQTWGESLARTFALPWTIGREPTDAPPGARPGPPTASGADTSSGLLQLVSAEVPELARAVTVRRMLTLTAPDEDVILAVDESLPLLVARAPGSTAGAEVSAGLVVLLATPLDLAWTDLPAKPLFVPLTQELIRQGVGGGGTRAGELVAGVRPARAAGATELRWAGVAGASIGVPTDDAGNASTPVRDAGIVTSLDPRGRVVAAQAVNPDTRASSTEAHDPAAVRSWLAAAVTPAGQPADPSRVAVLDAAGVLPSSGAGGPGRTPEPAAFVSLLLLGAAALLAVVESALARWVSHAGSSRAGSALDVPVSLAPRGQEAA